ncbi:MAG TPA: IclR family transcriptional regulator C-terminal domain-containing protein [Pseudonocardiaceae bacterium]|nr:IclR family transcriptional regulator C-terminal domain-containing protein [Pseudonocardiaceae bacterium]
MRGRNTSDTSDEVASSEGAGQSSGPRRNTDYVQSLERGLSVLRSFDPEHPRLTLTEVAGRTGLTRAAARRFLLTLVDLGYVSTDGRTFALRPTVLELGYPYLSTLSVPNVAMPFLNDLVTRVSASAFLSVLDDGNVFYVAQVIAKRMLAVTVPVGTRVPAYATAMGQVLLAALPAYERRAYLERTSFEPLTPATPADRRAMGAVLDGIYRDGYAVEVGSYEDGLHAVAVPVTDGHGTVVAALGVATQSTNPTPESLRDEFLPALLECTDQISSELGRLNMPASRG